MCVCVCAFLRCKQLPGFVEANTWRPSYLKDLTGTILKHAMSICIRALHKSFQPETRAGSPSGYRYPIKTRFEPCSNKLLKRMPGVQGTLMGKPHLGLYPSQISLTWREHSWPGSVAKQTLSGLPQTYFVYLGVD